jgi:DNA polymerase-3 subunit epsilon
MASTRTRLDALGDYVAIDTETTGLDTRWCDLIEVGAVRVSGGKVTERFSSLVKPSSLPIDSFIEELTGITSEELEGAPIPADVMPSLSEFIGDSPVVGHNVCFDARFLEKCYQESLGKGFGNELVDTLRISRHVFDDIKKRTLGVVVERCEREGVSSIEVPDSAHRALADSQAAAYCYETMRPLLVEKYGDDPEAGFSKQTRARGRSKAKFEDIVQTVDEIDESNPFYSSTICFTGTLDGMTRTEAWQHAVNLGATPKNSVTKTLDYLVVGSFEFNPSLHGKPSGKLQKAQEYAVSGNGISIVSDDFFLQYAKSDS